MEREREQRRAAKRLAADEAGRKGTRLLQGEESAEEKWRTPTTRWIGAEGGATQGRGGGWVPFPYVPEEGEKESAGCGAGGRRPGAEERGDEDTLGSRRRGSGGGREERERGRHKAGLSLCVWSEWRSWEAEQQREHPK
jgi:hypothetical protein